MSPLVDGQAPQFLAVINACWRWILKCQLAGRPHTGGVTAWLAGLRFASGDAARVNDGLATL